jgi:hypothetical protein
MNYEIYISNDEKRKGKRVLFEDGTDYCVQKDEEGHEYFPVPNFKMKDVFKSFTGRIKDAIEAIRKGEGDVLSVTNLFGKSEHVYYFIDRAYGEELRKKTIEGFKNTEFGYSLKFGFLDSFSGSRFIAKDNTILSAFDNQNDYVYFSTEKEAEEYKEKILKDAERFADNFNMIMINNKNNNIKIQKWFDKHYDNTISARIGGELSEDNNENNKWQLEIVQVIKP